jgi:prephenate dehydratase
VAQSLGAQILAHDIQDRRDNVTRFIALGRADAAPTGDDKTSLCFGFAEDRAGILVETLQELASTGVNMTKLESRPSKATLGEYIFLVDFNGHRADPRIAEMLERVKAKAGLFKIFGSYPCWRERSKAIDE